MNKTKALMVFCEGAHDIGFLYQVFKLGLNAKIAKGEGGDGLKFSEYPAPLNNLFATSVAKHAAMDLSLDMAHKFFLPDRTLEKDDWHIFLFNSGGKDKSDNIKYFIREFLTLYNTASVFPGSAKSIISEVKYLFFYDADNKGPNDVAAWMQRNFSSIEGTEWGLNLWTIDNDQKCIVQEDKALYVWGGIDGPGTLEDIIYPIYQNINAELIDKSKNFIEENFDWSIANKSSQQISKIQANKLKATLCAAGQGSKPGRPLSAIISDNALGDEIEMLVDDSFQSLIDFLIEFAGFNTGPE